MPTLDEAWVYSSLAGDPDMVELVEEFVGALPQRVEAVRAALQAQNLETLRRFAHQLKGASGGYGFSEIGKAASDLEVAAKSAAPMSDLTARVETLASLCQRARVRPE